MKPPAKAQEWIGAVMDAAGAAATLRRRAVVADIVADEASGPESRRPGVFQPGDRVVYSAQWLQLALGSRLSGYGPDALTRVWTIRACACELCTRGDFDFVCTTEPLPSGEQRHMRRSIVRHEGLVQADDLAALQLKRPKRVRRRP